MKKESMQAYTARITQASRTELIVIMYDIILEDIEEAKIAYQNSDMDKYVKTLKHASNFVYELMRNLDYQYKIAFDLISLYIYVNKCIITAIYEKKVEGLASVQLVIQKLMIGFEGICREDLSGPVMQNAPQIYAGLTYGRGSLNEIDIDLGQYNRGFKA